MEQPKLHSGHMEVAVANLIGYRANSIVPNVSWGLGLHHEADMLVLDRNGRFTEIEIKISGHDLIADFVKAKHFTEQKLISRLIYAIPIDLKNFAEEFIPKDYGIILVQWSEYSEQYKAQWCRMVKHNRKVEKPSPEKIKKFYELGLMRIWSLKSKLIYNNKKK